MSEIDKTPTEETRLVALLRSIDEPAPERLHRRVAELTAAAGRPRRGLRSPLGTRLGLAGVSLAGGLAAVIIALSGGAGTAAPTFAQETALTLRPATLPAPAGNRATRVELEASVEGVSFPSWERFGWRSTGARRDRLAGRDVQTVFYANDRGQRVGYAIVAGTGGPAVGGGVVHWRDGTPYRLVDQHGVMVVTWLRHGRRCVVSGQGVNPRTLLRLASWDDRA